MQRLTISLDDDLAAALDALQESGGESKAMLIRRALKTFLERQQGRERPTERDLQIWTHLLAGREHVILDVSHVRLIFEACQTYAPPEFWTELREVGKEHGRQYLEQGMKRVQDMLEVMESANWFLLSPETDRSWSLVFTEPSAKPFIKTFLEGFYSRYPVEVELIDERTKLRVRIASPPPVRVGNR